MSISLHNMRLKIPLSYCLFLLFIIITNQGVAQESTQYPYLRSWSTFLSQQRLHEKFSLGLELHERPNKFIADHGQFLVRPYFDYHVNDRFLASGGYTFISTKGLEQADPLHEHNVWEQIMLTNQFKAANFQHRFRIEHRWINTNIKERKAIYNTRFRYRLNAKVPLKEIGSKVLFIQVFDELWFTLADGFESFDFTRNWFYTGIGIDFNKLSNVHIGYMHQFNDFGIAEERTDIIQLTFQQNFDFRAAK